MKPRTLVLGPRALGEGQPCLVAAQVGSAHEGSADTALRMIDAAFEMGADGVVFQLFRSEQLVVRRHPERPELDAAELSPGDWRRVLDAARGSGLSVIAEVFDRPSLELAAAAEVAALQLHATDMDNPDLIRATGEAGCPVLLAAGGQSATVVREALDLAGGAVGLLHGPPLPPAPAEALRLRELAEWKERHRVPVGFLDPTDGGGAFALVAPAIAAVYGADLVEKHFTLDRGRRRPGHPAALAPEEFHRMVELLRQAERAGGDGAPAPEGEAARALRGVARSIVAGVLIRRGEVLSAPLLAFKRTDVRFPAGLSPREAHRVIGRRAARPIQADETIREDMLE